MEKNGYKDIFGVEIIRHPALVFKAAIGSVWEWEHYRKGKLIDFYRDTNLMVAEGLNYILDVALSGGTAITAFYIALFESDTTPADGDTYASPSFTETTAYDETTRQAWTEAGVSSKVITNSASKATFTFNASKTIYGGALVGGGTGADTKDDQAGGGKLICSSQFSTGSKAVVSTDVLKVTVTITASNVA